MSDSQRVGLGPSASAFIMAFGVILPAVTLFVEVYSGMCRSEFFDPIPSLLHAVLIASTIVVNLIGLFIVNSTGSDQMKELYALLLGFAGVVSLYYAVVFAPMLPLAIIAIIIVIGLLPLAPLTSAISLWLLMLPALKRGFEEHRRKRLYAMLGLGMLLSLSTLLYADYRVSATNRLITKVSSSDEDERVAAIEKLRSPLHRRQLATMCHGNWTPIAGPFTALGLRGADAEDARSAWFFVTGSPWSPPPFDEVNTRVGFGGFASEDDLLGTTTVGRILPHVKLKLSSLEGDIDTKTAVSYSEWTFEFSNSGRFQDEEARFRMALPPGGVVSKLTLWVNGEPREAAFDAPGKVTAAYQEVAVRQRLDPVLVTSSGPDEVMAQCFPIPAGGEMKIRMGITAPLIPEFAADGDLIGKLVVPYITERNFTVTDSEVNRGYFNATAEVLSTPPNWTPLSPNEVIGSGLAEAGSFLSVDMKDHRPSALITDPFNDEQLITQTIKAGEEIKSPIILIIDTGASVADSKDIILAAIEAVGNSEDPTFYIAGDRLYTETNAAAAQKRIEEVGLIGGRDSARALQEAWVKAKANRGRIIWLHGAQHGLAAPLNLLGAGRSVDPIFYTVRIGNGRNRVLEALEQQAPTAALPAAKLPEDLVTFIRNDDRVPQIKRTAVARADVSVTDEVIASPHVARLWAVEKIRSSSGALERNAQELGRLGKRYQLVTPYTGAVVLETAEQFRRADLQPVDPNTVPAVPEPEVWLLIIIATLALVLVYFLRKRDVISLR